MLRKRLTQVLSGVLTLGMLDVDQLDVQVLLVGLSVGIDLGADQQFENGFIVLDQAKSCSPGTSVGLKQHAAPH